MAGVVAGRDSTLAHPAPQSGQREAASVAGTHCRGPRAALSQRPYHRPLDRRRGGQNAYPTTSAQCPRQAQAATPSTVAQAEAFPRPAGRPLHRFGQHRVARPGPTPLCHHLHRSAFALRLGVGHPQPRQRRRGAVLPPDSSRVSLRYRSRTDRQRQRIPASLRPRARHAAVYALAHLPQVTKDERPLRTLQPHRAGRMHRLSLRLALPRRPHRLQPRTLTLPRLVQPRTTSLQPHHTHPGSQNPAPTIPSTIPSSKPSVQYVLARYTIETASHFSDTI